MARVLSWNVKECLQCFFQCRVAASTWWWFCPAELIRTVKHARFCVCAVFMGGCELLLMAVPLYSDDWRADDDENIVGMRWKYPRSTIAKVIKETHTTLCLFSFVYMFHQNIVHMLFRSTLRDLTHRNACERNIFRTWTYTYKFGCSLQHFHHMRSLLVYNKPKYSTWEVCELYTCFVVSTNFTVTQNLRISLAFAYGHRSCQPCRESTFIRSRRLKQLSALCLEQKGPFALNTV